HGARRRRVKLPCRWSTRNAVSNCPPRLALRRETLGEAGGIDPHALVRAPADLLDLVMRRHRKHQLSPLPTRDLGPGRDTLAYRRRRQVANVDRGADSALIRLQIVANGVQRRVLHRQYHQRRGKYRRKYRVLELARQVRRRDVHHEAPLRSDWYSTHLSL